MHSRPSALATWMALLRAQQAIDSVSRESIGRAGLCLSEFVLLEALYSLGHLTPSRLARRAGLTRASITAAVDRLLERGLVTRAENVADARSSIIALTPDGRRVIEATLATHSDRMSRVLADAFCAGQRRELFRLLLSLRRAAARSLPDQSASDSDADGRPPVVRLSASADAAASRSTFRRRPPRTSRRLDDPRTGIL